MGSLVLVFSAAPSNLGAVRCKCQSSSFLLSTMRTRACTRAMPCNPGRNGMTRPSHSAMTQGGRGNNSSWCPRFSVRHTSLLPTPRSGKPFRTTSFRPLSRKLTCMRKSAVRQPSATNHLLEWKKPSRITTGIATTASRQRKSTGCEKIMWPVLCPPAAAAVAGAANPLVGLGAAASVIDLARGWEYRGL